MGALQGLLWLKSGAPCENENSLVNSCNNDIATTTTHATTKVTIDESTLILHPKKKKKKINHKSTVAPEKKLRRTVTPENLPNFGEVDDAPTTLHSEEDKDYINPIHTIIRKDIIEVFVDKSDKSTAGVTKKNDRKATKANAGRIGLRCKFCKHLPSNKRANLSTIYPESLDGIYRAISVRFQKKHLGKCQHIPQSIMSDIKTLLKEKNVRGSKGYWAKSAHRLGLRDSDKCLIYCPTAK